MNGRPEDWDELFLRYLAGEADPEQEKQVRAHLLSDAAARERLVTLACQQQALADVLGDAAQKTPSSRVLAPRPSVRRRAGPGIPWMLAAAAVALAAIGILYVRSGENLPAPRRETPKLEARAPEKTATPEPEPKKPVPVKEKLQLPPPPVPEPERKDPITVPPAPKPIETQPATPKAEDPQPPTPAPKPESPPRGVTGTAVATIERVEGEVAVLSAESRTAAAAKSSILSGQGLETVGAASSVEISYPDGTRVKLDPGTLVKEIADGDKKGKRLFLARGGLWASVRNQPADQPMILTTSTGEAKVLGTKLRLVFDERGATRLEVEEGKVRLKRLADQKFVDVTSGHFAVATSGVELKPLPTIQLGLTGYWRFEDQAGATMSDSSGLGNHGTLVGKARRTLGKFGQGLEVDGATAFVEVPHSASLNPGLSPFTISLWQRNRKQDVWHWNLVFKSDAKFRNYYYLAVGTKPRFEFATGDAKVTIDGQAGVNDNRWHHLVVVRNGPYSAQLYVDGVLDSSASTPPSESASVQTTGPLLIGAGNQTFFAGQIDDVRFYDRALSPDEIRQLYSGR